jgi:hypothetical protein
MAKTALILILALACASSGAAQRRVPPVPATSSSAHPVSPVVVATWIASVETSGERELQLLVLWRGTPGWFYGGRSRGSGGGGGLIRHSASFGDIMLDVELQTEDRVARVQGQTLSLGNANVILVDDVDSGSPRVLGTRTVDAQLSASGSPDVAGQIIRKSPDLLAFLKCDVVVPDPKLQPAAAALCAQSGVRVSP